MEFSSIASSRWSGVIFILPFSIPSYNQEVMKVISSCFRPSTKSSRPQAPDCNRADLQVYLYLHFLLSPRPIRYGPELGATRRIASGILLLVAGECRSVPSVTSYQSAVTRTGLHYVTSLGLTTLSLALSFSLLHYPPIVTALTRTRQIVNSTIIEKPI